MLKILTQLTHEMGFHGGQKADSDTADLSLETIERILVLMGAKRAELPLKLGADPNAVKNGISLLQLANALHHEEVSHLLKEYGAYSPKKHQPKS